MAYTPTHLPVEQAKPQPPPQVKMATLLHSLPPPSKKNTVFELDVQLVGEELEEFCKMFPAIDRTVIQVR